MRSARADAPEAPASIAAASDLAARGLGTLRRPSSFKPVDAEARMNARSKACKIRGIEGGLIDCACGWHYREREAHQFGPRSLMDLLLDRYNAHRAGEPRSAQDST